LKLLLLRAGYQISQIGSSPQPFHTWHYLRHNARRLEHLASLGIPVFNKSVLEVGAGIGDHTHYYLDRGCKVTITEPREENLIYLRKRYPEMDVRELDLERPNSNVEGRWDVVHCYGLLYHLQNPGPALQFMAKRNGSLLLLETCVSFGSGMKENLTPEDQKMATQAFSGTGCRPTRDWIVEELKKLYEHVYCTKTQPNHDEFPLDWTRPEAHKGLSRAVFVASRQPLDTPALTKEIPLLQIRHP
jgi:SAM-dependent methyltransferase